MQRIFGELHRHLTYLDTIFLSLLTYISAYFIDFVIFTSNVIFKGIFQPKVLPKAEIGNSGILEYNSQKLKKTFVLIHKSYIEEICNSGIFSSNEPLENYNLKGCVRYILGSLALSLNESTCETWKNNFCFT